MPNVIPGKQGADYKLVQYGGKVYAVYRVQLPGGRWINTTWRVPESDYKALGIKAGEAKKINRAAFRQLNVFGDIGEIAQPGEDKHPFQNYLDHLVEVNGKGVSWLKNAEFMETMLMGWAEGWSAEELRQKLTTTQWYQSRTDYERRFALEMSDAQKKADRTTWEERMRASLEGLYGAGVSMEEAGFNEKQLQDDLDKLVSGRWGDPSDGFSFWLQKQEQSIRKIEGTQAWADWQQQQSDLNAQINRPEEMYQQITTTARDWLGARAVPDEQTLRSWASRLVTGESSDADFQQFLEGQAKALYPYLAPGERFVDRASAYKRIAEEELGTTIGWDDPMLYQLGEKTDAGEFTGNAMTYDAFTTEIRKRDDWWTGQKAADEGFQLLNYLNETFNGVSA